MSVIPNRGTVRKGFHVHSCVSQTIIFWPVRVPPIFIIPLAHCKLRKIENNLSMLYNMHVKDLHKSTGSKATRKIVIKLTPEKNLN